MVFKLSIFVVNEFYYRDFICMFGNVIEEIKICVVVVCGRRFFRLFDNFVEVMCQFIDEFFKDGRVGILCNYFDFVDCLELFIFEF